MGLSLARTVQFNQISDLSIGNIWTILSVLQLRIWKWISQVIYNVPCAEQKAPHNQELLRDELKGHKITYIADIVWQYSLPRITVAYYSFRESKQASYLCIFFIDCVKSNFFDQLDQISQFSHIIDSETHWSIQIFMMSRTAAIKVFILHSRPTE